MRDGCADVEHWPTISLMPWVVDGQDNEWVITGVQVQRSFRGQGWASKLLDQVLADADTEGATLLLDVRPDGTGLDEEALRAFYSRRGFRPDPTLGECAYRRLSAVAATVPS